MPSHDSPKHIRKEGKSLSEAKIAAVTKLYDSAPYPTPGHPGSK